MRDPSLRRVVDQLHRLRRKIYRCGEEGRKYRVEFLCLAFKHGLDGDVRHYRLWDEGWEELGERQWDTCFEMGDAESVIAEVVTRARQEDFLDAVRAYCNMPGAFERWLAYADKQTVLF